MHELIIHNKINSLQLENRENFHFVLTLRKERIEFDIMFT